MKDTIREQIVEVLGWLLSHNQGTTAENVACFTTFRPSVVKTELSQMVQEEMLVMKDNQYEFTKGYRNS